MTWFMKRLANLKGRKKDKEEISDGLDIDQNYEPQNDTKSEDLEYDDKINVKDDV